jgi:hypothetical protein
MEMIRNIQLRDFSLGPCYLNGPAMEELKLHLPKLWQLFEYRLQLGYDELDTSIELVFDMFPPVLCRRTIIRQSALVVDLVANSYLKRLRLPSP